jgi:hypothetical protein
MEFYIFVCCCGGIGAVIMAAIHMWITESLPDFTGPR